MWNGKKKAITFSFDDGVMQDVRAVEILNKYGLKATFNLNSGKFGTNCPYEPNGRVVDRRIIEPTMVKSLYEKHEVAVHTVGHFNLTTLPDSCVTWQVEKDRELLEELTGKEIRCMAYPCGGVNNTEHVASIVKDTTKVRFARTIFSAFSFVLAPTTQVVGIPRPASSAWLGPVRATTSWPVASATTWLIRMWVPDSRPLVTETTTASGSM